MFFLIKELTHQNYLIMKKINLLIVLLFCINYVTGQESPAITSYNQIRGSSTIKLINNFSNGDLALIGENTPINSEKKNLFIIRTNPLGNVIWEKEFFSDRVLAVNDFLIDIDDNIIIAAEQYEEGNRESLFLLALDGNGKQLFSSHFNEANGEIEAYNIALDIDGGFLITGFCKIPTVLSDIFFKMVKEEQFLYLLKINSVGEKVWSKYVEEDYFVSAGKEIIIDKKSIVNIFSNNHKDNKENVIKLITSKDNDTFQEYILVADNNVILADVAYNGNSVYLIGLVINDKKTDYYDIFLVKLNEKYELEYNKIISTNYNDWPSGISIKENTILLFGELNKNNKKSLYFLELNNEISFVSMKTYNTPYKDISLMDGIITDKGFVAVGSHWQEKRSGILLNTKDLIFSEKEFNIQEGSFVVQKSKKGRFVNLNKKEIIKPVELKEFKY